jgi:hypothetical protein
MWVASGAGHRVVSWSHTCPDDAERVRVSVRVSGDLKTARVLVEEGRDVVVCWILMISLWLEPLEHGRLL